MGRLSFAIVVLAVVAAAYLMRPLAAAPVASATPVRAPFTIKSNCGDLPADTCACVTGRIRDLIQRNGVVPTEAQKAAITVQAVAACRPPGAQ